MWEVGEDLIDLDHWAHSYVALRVAEKGDERSSFIRYGYWPIMALVVIVIGATSSVGMAMTLAAFLAVVFVGVRLWNRSAATRLAKRLHGLAAASEPFTFRADADGTHSRSESGAEDLAWSRWKAVRIQEDLVVLTLDTDMMRMLPIRGLTSQEPPSTAVDTIAGWISGAGSSSASAS